MFKVQSTGKVGGCVCVCASHLAKKRGFESCCGVAGVKKLAKGHLQEKRDIFQFINFAPTHMNAHRTKLGLN